jgi:hypothetical protein
MENSMSFKWDRAFTKMVTSLVAVLGLSANLYATSHDKNQSKEKPGPFAFVFPKDLNLTNPYDFYVSAQVLIFQAQQDGLEFAINNDLGSTVNLVDAEYQGFANDGDNWDYNVGSRVNAGFYFPHDAWNIDVTWTWFHVPDSAKAEGTNLVPLWTNRDYNATSLATATSANATWNCNFNALDIQLAKPYHVSRMLIFNPHFGVRAGWIYQNLSADFAGLSAGPARAIFHGKNDFWGIGPRVGIDSTWLLGCEWKLFCNVAASVLSGQFNTSQNVDYPAASGSSRNVTNNFHMNVPNLDIALGFDWGTYLCHKKYYLDFIVGYEFQVWWDQFNLKNQYLGNSTQGNFTLNGFTFKVQLDM